MMTPNQRVDAQGREPYYFRIRGTDRTIPVNRTVTPSGVVWEGPGGQDVTPRVESGELEPAGDPGGNGRSNKVVPAFDPITGEQVGMYGVPDTLPGTVSPLPEGITTVAPKASKIASADKDKKLLGQIKSYRVTFEGMKNLGLGGVKSGPDDIEGSPSAFVDTSKNWFGAWGNITNPIEAAFAQQGQTARGKAITDYLALKDPFVANLARIAGETGVLSNQDINRVLKALPDPASRLHDIEFAKKQFAVVEYMMDVIEARLEGREDPAPPKGQNAFGPRVQPWANTSQPPEMTDYPPQAMPQIESIE
jgi:hypothetical protein